MIKTNYCFPYRRKFNRLVWSLVIFSCAIFIIGLMIGTTPIGMGKLFYYFSSGDTATNFIIKLRFQREITAFCCGGMLALGSAILQGLTRNPMVAPDLTGMTSIGCLLIVACEIFWFKSPMMNELLGISGAVLGFLLCFFLAKNYRSNNRLTVILTGISISFTANAIMQLLVLHAPQDMDDYLHFITGSLYAIEGLSVAIVLVITLIVVPAAFILSKRFTVLSLDDQTCQTIGVPVKRFLFIAFLIAALLIGTSVMGVGHLGFLGIVSPNIARIFVGDRSHYVFPLSFLMGGLIYLIADTLGRCLISPAEIPAGIMTNMLSAPLFLYILYRYYRGQHAWH